jgi:hypothetical protein
LVGPRSALLEGQAKAIEPRLHLALTAIRK